MDPNRAVVQTTFSFPEGRRPIRFDEGVDRDREGSQLLRQLPHLWQKLPSTAFPSTQLRQETKS